MLENVLGAILNIHIFTLISCQYKIKQTLHIVVILMYFYLLLHHTILYAIHWVMADQHVRNILR